MNWMGTGRAGVAMIVSAGLALGATACSRDYTVAYVYATASTNTTTGVVDGYLVDYQSGALTQLANSPTPSGGRNPVTLVAAPSGKYIYVVHRDDASVVQFAVGTDGKLYPQSTVNTVGTFPLAAAVDSTGTFLYVLSTYQPGFTNALPGPGNISVFPIDPAKGTLGAPTAVNVGNSPVAIAVAPYANGAKTHFVYVVDRETVTSSGRPQPQGSVLTFSQASGSATLTPAGSSVTAGVQPSGAAVDPTARFLYVTDALSNQLIGYQLNSGLPTAMTNGPFTTGQFPSSVTIEPRGKYMYVTNQNDGSVSAYAIDTLTGNPAGAVGSSGARTGPNPVCVTVEPALGIYVYTANNTDQTVSGFELDPHNGTLKNIQNTPFNASSLPSCVVAVANGAHATQALPQ